MDLRELYQEVIIDHNRNPRNFCELSHPTHQAEGFNPLCGDRISLYLRVQNDKIIDVGFQGSGCAISTASSSIMTDMVKGKSVFEAEKLLSDFLSLLTGKAIQADAAEMGKLEVLAGVKEYPARVKCATLAWHALQEALQNEAKS